jgi:hypothetical protein
LKLQVIPNKISQEILAVTVIGADLDTEIYKCSVCEELVEAERMAEHLSEHHSGAWAMDPQDVSESFLYEGSGLTLFESLAEKLVAKYMSDRGIDGQIQEIEICGNEAKFKIQKTMRS